jgi:pyridinium-3,5-bisthiocarboxylic acid mononucleotide nickel chelatase
MMGDPRGSHLYFDCFSGMAGDMTLGALLDLGVPEAVVREALDGLPLRGYRLQVGRTERSGISACDVRVEVHADAGAHAHRAWRDIRPMIPAGRPSAIFSRLAAAEARVHGVAVDDVEFHEVGAIDSIVDVVGSGAALDWLCPARITARAVPLGRGLTHGAHGPLCVPPPAVLEILLGSPVEDGGASVELTTPTGAAILAACCDGFGPMPAGRPVAVGYGAGDQTLPDRPNVLRVVALEQVASADRVLVLEANLDDMNPELCEHVAEAMYAAGARDVWFSPIVMKKSRPALLVGALCGEAERDAVAGALLRESTTIGLRFWPADRRVLDRRAVRVATPYGEVEIKVGEAAGRVVNVAPEYESARRAARASGAPLKDVYAAALAAYHGGPRGER